MVYPCINICTFNGYTLGSPRSNTGLAVAATVCQSGVNERILVQCINMAAQPQELCTVSVVRIFTLAAQNS